MADLSPYMIGALAQAIRSGDPALINGTVGAVNAITQARTGGAAGSADWSYERDPKTGATYAFNRRTTERRELDPGRKPGEVDPNTDRIVQPSDPDYHKYAPQGDTRPWRLTTDDKGNVKPEPVTESPEFDQSTKLAEKIEANPQYKTYQAGSSALDVLHSNLNEGTPEADLAGIFSFMKSLDPVSAVREGEQDAMRGASGPFAGLWAQYNKLVGSGAFTPEQRQRFYNTAVESLKAQGQGAQNAVDEQRRRAAAFKIDPNKVSTWKPRDLKRVDEDHQGPGDRPGGRDLPQQGRLQPEPTRARRRAARTGSATAGRTRGCAKDNPMPVTARMISSRKLPPKGSGVWIRWWDGKLEQR